MSTRHSLLFSYVLKKCHISEYVLILIRIRPVRDWRILLGWMRPNQFLQPERMRSYASLQVIDMELQRFEQHPSKHSIPWRRLESRLELFWRANRVR